MKRILFLSVFYVSSVVIIVMGVYKLQAAELAGAKSLDSGKGYADESAIRAEKEKKQLLAQVLKKISLQGPQAEQDALLAILAKMLDSEYARSLSKDFLLEDFSVVLAFADIPGTRIYELYGEKHFSAGRGYTRTDLEPQEIRLNRALLQAQTEEAPGSLACELFGHARNYFRARKYHLEKNYRYHSSEEASSALIGWIIDSELGIAPSYWCVKYLESPGGYARLTPINSPYYSKRLNTAEMKKAEETYLLRLRTVEKELAGIPEQRKALLRGKKFSRLNDAASGARVVTPAGSAHKPDDYDVKLSELKYTERTLGATKTKLAEFQRGWGTVKWVRWCKYMATISESPFFKQLDSETAERSRLLLISRQSGKNRKTGPYKDWNRQVPLRK
jgi:hypothetical protein